MPQRAFLQKRLNISHFYKFGNTKMQKTQTKSNTKGTNFSTDARKTKTKTNELVPKLVLWVYPIKTNELVPNELIPTQIESNNNSTLQQGEWVCEWKSLSRSCPTLRDPKQVGILEWVAFSFSRVSSQPRDWTQVSCIAGGLFTSKPQGKPLQRGTATKLPCSIKKKSNWGTNMFLVSTGVTYATKLGPLIHKPRHNTNKLVAELGRHTLQNWVH